MKYGTHPEQTMRSGPLFDRVPVRSDLSHSLRNSDAVDCPNDLDENWKVPKNLFYVILVPWTWIWSPIFDQRSPYQVQVPNQDQNQPNIP